MSYSIPPDFLRYYTDNSGGGGTVTVAAVSPLIWDVNTSTMSILPASNAQGGYVTRFNQDLGGRKTIQGVTSNTNDSQQFAATDGVVTGYMGITTGALTLTSPSSYVETAGRFYSKSVASDSLRSDGGAIIAGPVSITDTTNATSFSTGALTVAGGMSCGETLWPKHLRMGSPCVFVTNAINAAANASVLIISPIIITQSFLSTTTGYIVKVTFECVNANPVNATCDILSNLVILPGVRPTGTLLTSSTAVFAVSGGILHQKWAAIFTNNITINAGDTYAFVLSIPGTDGIVSITDTSAYADGDLWINDTIFATDDLTFEVSTGSICSASVDVISDDGTLSANSSVTLPTQRAVKQYADSIVSGAINIPYTQIAYGNNANVINSSQEFRVDISDPNASSLITFAPTGVKKTYIKADEVADVGSLETNATTMELWANSSKMLVINDTDIESHGYLKFTTGADKINEISDDTTLAGDSSIAATTEHAVKTYVDTRFTSPITFDGVVNDLTLTENSGVWDFNRNLTLTAIKLGASTNTINRVLTALETGLAAETNVYSANATDAKIANELVDLLKAPVVFGGVVNDLTFTEAAGVWSIDRNLTMPGLKLGISTNTITRVLTAAQLASAVETNIYSSVATNAKIAAAFTAPTITTPTITAPVTFSGVANDMILSESSGIWSLDRTISVNAFRIGASASMTTILPVASIGNTSDTAIPTSSYCKLDRQIRQTGLVSGGTLSINADTTKFNIAAGSAWFVDQSTNAKTLITWNALNANTTTYLASSASSWVGLFNNSGTIGIYQTDVPLEALERRTIIQLGRLAHFNKTIINGVFTLPVLYNDEPLSTDMAISNGVTLQEGFLVTPNANLTFAYSTGKFMRLGGNFITSAISPNVVTVLQSATASFRRVYRTGLDDIVLSSAVTTLDPLNYDTGSGSLTLVPVNRFSIQWIVVYPYNTSVTIFVLYGQDVTYLNLQDAINDLGYTLDIHTPVEGGIIRGAIIIRQDQTNLVTAISNGYAKIVMFGKAGK